MQQSVKVWSFVALAVFVAAGCTRQQQQETEETGQAVVEETGEAVEAVGEGAAEVADEAEDLVDDETSIELNGESGVSGEADLRMSGNSTRIEIEVDGLQADGIYTAHLMSGGCGTGGAEVAELESFTAADGSGGSTSTIAVGTVASGQSIVIHDPAGATLACGEVPTDYSPM